MSDDPELDRERRAFVPEAEPQQELPKMADKDDLYLAEPEKQSDHAPGETVTREAITRDPWAAVYLPLPSAPSPELVVAAHQSAEYCFEAELSTAETARLRSQGQDGLSAGHAFSPMQDGFGYGIDPQENADKALVRLIELEKIDPTLERVGPHSREDDKPELAADFRAAAHDTTMTPQNDREADVASVIRGLEEATGLKGTPERAAYAKGWQALGDQITSEPDPDKRAELRDVREALSHDYAADLADKAGTLLDVNGDHEGAADMQMQAALRREVAAELRGNGPENAPENDPTQPPNGRPEIGATVQEAAGPSAREEFAEAAIEASGLRHSPRVEFVVEGPSKEAPRSYEETLGERLASYRAETEAGNGRSVALEAGREDEAPTRPELSHNIRPEVGMGPGGLEVYTTVKASEFVPDPAEMADLAPVRPEERIVLEAQAAESTKRQDAELAAAMGQEQPGGGVVVSYEDRIAARMEARAAEAEKGGNERESIREVAAAAFRSFGMV